VRKAPLVVAATLQDCMIFWIQRACVYSAGLDQSAIRRQKPGCSEQVILIRRLILSHRLRHCTKLGNAETEANGAFREEEITVADDEYTSTRACLGGLGDADALHMPASITRQT